MNEIYNNLPSASSSIGSLIQHWQPHPGWPRPALAASRPHPGWPRPALAASSWMASTSIGSLTASSWMASSSIGSLILDSLVQHWWPRGLILDGLIQHWQYNLGWRQIIVEFYFSLFMNEIYNNLPMIPRWLLSRAGTLAKIMMKANYCIILFYSYYEWNLQQFALKMSLTLFKIVQTIDDNHYRQIIVRFRDFFTTI